MIKAMKLPYGTRELEPYVSHDQLYTHYHDHYKVYVDKVNDLVKDHDLYKELEVEDLIMRTSNQHDELSTSVYQYASQVWNHELFFNTMSTSFHDYIEDFDRLESVVKKCFGKPRDLYDEIMRVGTHAFASNWLTMIYNVSKDELELHLFKDEQTPLNQFHASHNIPVLTIDLWEHSYYIDHKADRRAYLEGLYITFDWGRVDKLIKQARADYD